MNEPGFRIVPAIKASQSRRRRYDPVAVAGWALSIGLATAFWVAFIAWAVQ